MHKMGKVLNIQPVSRIEGHARISVHLNDDGNVEDAFMSLMSLRGFEKFIEGRPGRGGSPYCQPYLWHLSVDAPYRLKQGG